ncbi:MAG: hypothetical protein NTU44_16590 [Bacteroidetes bacterium]|nr:hypothetical protein [Bacteroidota bacterium]
MMTPESWREQMLLLIEEFHSSGLTRKDLCTKKVLATNTFYYWQRKYGEQAQGILEGSFVSVKTIGKPGLSYAK